VRDTRVVKTLALSERQALLAAGEGEEGAAAAAAPKTTGLPPRPTSLALSTPNGRSPTNGPMDGS